MKKMRRFSKLVSGVAVVLGIALSFSAAGCFLFETTQNDSDDNEYVPDDSGYHWEEPNPDAPSLPFTGTAYKKVGTITYSYKTFDIVQFGDWPQTIKANNVTIDQSSKVETSMFTYYKGSDNAWYVAWKENGYINRESGSKPAKYSNNVEVKASNTTLYFKVEPIKWRVATENYNGKKLLLAESILTGSCFHPDNKYRDTIAPNNYENSYIRAYLNGIAYSQGYSGNNYDLKNNGFLQYAFTKDLQSSIATTSVKNDAASTIPYGLSTQEKTNDWNNGENDFASDTVTKDKIFLLSVYEATYDKYGFSLYTTSDELRTHPATDFAKANGTKIHYNDVGSTGIGDWWLRSPDAKYVSGVNSQYYARIINTNTCNARHGIDTKYIGVVPALCVN